MVPLNAGQALDEGAMAEDDIRDDRHIQGRTPVGTRYSVLRA